MDNKYSAVEQIGLLGMLFLLVGFVFGMYLLYIGTTGENWYQIAAAAIILFRMRGTLEVNKIHIVEPITVKKIDMN